MQKRAASAGSWRRAAVWIHNGLGVGAGVFFSLLGLTGSILLYRGAIESRLFPLTQTAGSCNAQWRLEPLEARFATMPELRIYSADAKDPRIHVRVSEDGTTYRHFAYDACAGEFLGEVQLGWMDALVDFHHNFLAGKAGRRWVGVASVALLSTCLTGLFIWLKTNPRWQATMRVRWRAALPVWLLDAHRLIGLAGMAVLLVQAFGGVWLAYPETLRGWLAQVAPVRGADEKKRAKQKEGNRFAPKEHLPMANLIAAGATAAGGGEVREIRTSAKSDQVQIRLYAQSDVRSGGSTTVILNRVTGQVTSLRSFAQFPSGDRAIETLTAIHYGQWGGGIWRFVFFLAGLSPASLFITGGVVWWRRRRKRAVTASTVQPAAISVEAFQ